MTKPGSDATTRSSLEALARRWPLFVATGLAILAGYQISYGSSQPGLSSLGGAFLAVAWVGVILLLFLAGGIAAIRGSGVAARRLSAGTGALVLGTAIGLVATPAIGLTYHEPVVLHSAGHASGSFEGVNGFVAAAIGPATCDSISDSTTVGGVTVVKLGTLDAGKLGSGPVRASVYLDPAAATATVQLYVDAAPLPPDSLNPSWEGTGTLADLSSGRASGTLAFEHLAFNGTSDTWPTSLSGAIQWQCDPWIPANGAPPPSGGVTTSAGGTATVTFEGVAWDAKQPMSAACARGIDGSVRTVDLRAADGTLQGLPVEIELDLTNDVTVGDNANLSIVLSGKDPPAGLTFMPNWRGRVAITQAAPGLASGTVAFTDLATGVDPAIGPAPTGWPTTLTGSISWSCG